MKQILRAFKETTQNVATFSAIAALLLAGCSKPGSSGGDSTVGAPSAPVPRGDLTSAEPTSFYEVAKHLDAGGSLYGYLRTSQWLQGLSTNVAAWQGLIQALPNVPTADKEKLARVFSLVTNLIANSGIEEIDGVGVSGIALEPGYYQTKLMLHRNPSAKSGYLWTVAGSAPRPLSELDLLPADTVLASFGDLSLGAVWQILKEEASNAQIAEVVAGLGQVEAQIEKLTGTSLSDLLNSLGGQQGILVTLSSTRTVKIPLPNGQSLEIPEPALLLAIKVNDDKLFNVIDRALQNVPNVIRTEEEGLKARSMALPVPVPINIKPTVARHGNHLFLASNDELVRSVIAVQAGKAKGVKSTDEFKRLAKGMPAEGNSFSFLSERLTGAFRQVQEVGLESFTLSNPSGEQGAELLRKLMQTGVAPSSYSVGSNTKEGWLLVGHGNQEPAQAIFVPLVVAPAAVVGAVALPAVARARARAQDSSCVNNLKQIGLASLMWANDHNNRFPNSLLVLTNQLGSPRVLVCPQDTKVTTNPQNLTWASLNASQISYQLVSPGMSLTTPNAAKEVLARCTVHGHTCFADGHVEQAAQSPAPRRR